MAIQILSILRTLAPLIVQAGGVAAGLRTASGAKTEERVARLEQEAIRAGEVLSGVALQLQAVAEQLRVQAELTEAMQRRSWWMLGLGAGALVVALIALGVVLAR